MAGPRESSEAGPERQERMVRLFKLILVLAVLGFVALVGYAYLGDLSPTSEDVSEPVTLDAD